MLKSTPPKRPEPSQVTHIEFRKRLTAYLDQVCDSRAPLHVMRQNGPGVVVISEEEFDELMETVQLLRSPANVRRLLESIVAADAGKLDEHGLIEP
jgi:antitoxin YefM